MYRYERCSNRLDMNCRWVEVRDLTTRTYTARSQEMTITGDIIVAFRIGHPRHNFVQAAARD